jgi:hypothetical protein
MRGRVARRSELRLRQSRTPYFEVHRLLRRRWRIDAIFADRQSAIEDAKRIMQGRRGLDGVRVLRVEEQDQGFLEWTVYLSAHSRARRRRAGTVAVAAPLAPRPRPPARAAFNGASALTLAGLLLACGLLILFAHRPRTTEWVFDRPEAWQPHELRNPWTGEVSKSGGEWGE